MFLNGFIQKIKWIWDDHDYGKNDGGVQVSLKRAGTQDYF